MTAVDVLREARALYAANPSHASAGDLPAEGYVCPVTAINRVTDGNGTWHPAYDALCDAIGIRGGVAEWNAKHSTEEVLAAFDRAIELAEAGQ